MRYLIWIVITFLTLTACSSIGPRQMTLDRGRYNDVIQTTNNQQLLKNIVVLRYVEPTSFLKVTSVTASQTFNPSLTNNSLGLAYTTGRIAGATTSTLTKAVNLDPGVNYIDSPTISYSPIDDNDFASSLLSPITLTDLHLLAYGGIHEPYLLTRLAIQAIDDMDNASEASGAKMLEAPEYKQFYRFLDVLVDLIKQRKCQFLPAEVEKKYALAIHCRPAYANNAEVRSMRRMLKVPQNNKDIILTEVALEHMPPNVLPIETRSIYGIMTYLSYSVQVPEADIKAHYVYQTRNQDGSLFDWTPLMEGIMTIYSSDNEPTDTFVKITHHGHWFFIKNCDLDSKATFSLLTRLFTLAARRQTAGIQQAPVLTIPAR